MDPTDMPAKPITTLSPADRQAVDALIEAAARGTAALKLAGFDEDATTVMPLPAGDGTRAERASKLLALIGHCPTVNPSDDLVHRTLTKINTEGFKQPVYQSFGYGLAGPSFRWSDLLGVAAVIMIGFSLIWPVLERSRADARRIECANNLAAAGAAIGSYAADHSNTLPRGNIQPGSVWWNVGQAASEEGPIQSNSAHLYLLIREGYAHSHALTCPDNVNAPDRLDPHNHDWASAPAVSYSYQNQYNEQPTRLDGIPDMAILADKNPLFAAQAARGIGLAYRGDLAPNTASSSHGERGQNILTASGQVLWSESPVIGDNDNIWLIRGVDQYQGTEVPDAPQDAFLVP